MRKLTKVLLAGAVLLSLGGSTVATAAAVTINNTLEELRCRSISDNLSIRSRVSQLEAVLTDKLPELMDKASEVLSAAQGDHDEAQDAIPANADASDKEQPADVPADAPADGMGEVTSPALHAVDAPAETYVIRTYNGIVGVFDGDGLLIRTVNTAVDTLPAADREALENGITAESFERMCEIADMYA